MTTVAATGDASRWPPRGGQRGLAVRRADRAVRRCCCSSCPLVLVLRMSVTDWPLLTGDRGWNFPDELQQGAATTGSSPLGVVHRQVHRARDGPADRAGPRARAAGAGVDALERLLRTAFLVPARSASPRPPCCSTSCTRRSPGRSPRRSTPLGSGFLGTPMSALCSTLCPDRLALRRLLHAAAAGRAAEHPGDVYEAARIDGASRWQTFRRITLPLLRPTLALSTVLCVTGSLLAFDQFYILTKGGPDNSTITIVQLVYNVAFQGQTTSAAPPRCRSWCSLALSCIIVNRPSQLAAWTQSRASEHDR